MRFKLISLVFMCLLSWASAPYAKDSIRENAYKPSKKTNSEQSPKKSHEQEVLIYATDFIVSMPGAPVSLISVLLVLFTVFLFVNYQRILQEHFNHDPHFVLMVTKQRISPGQAP